MNIPNPSTAWKPEERLEVIRAIAESRTNLIEEVECPLVSGTREAELLRIIKTVAQAPVEDLERSRWCILSAMGI